VPNLAWFGVLSALVSLVLIRIVVVTSQSYGLSRFALEMVVRVLVLELIPLCAAAFVALRTTLPAGLELAQRRHAAAANGGDCIANSSRAWRPACSRCGCWRRSAAC
jgi:phospholipid/cholesterol/gamma-HCH transport system permease protein